MGATTAQPWGCGEDSIEEAAQVLSAAWDPRELTEDVSGCCSFIIALFGGKSEPVRIILLSHSCKGKVPKGSKKDL